MYCKDCKFWGAYWEGCCDKEGYYSNEEQKFEIDYGASDDTGIYARLETGPMFGCVLFEPKEGE